MDHTPAQARALTDQIQAAVADLLGQCDGDPQQLAAVLTEVHQRLLAGGMPATAAMSVIDAIVGTEDI